MPSIKNFSFIVSSLTGLLSFITCNCWCIIEFCGIKKQNVQVSDTTGADSSNEVKLIKFPSNPDDSNQVTS